MATHYDLEEQEQLAQLKHFWSKHGNWITWLAIAVLAAFAGWNGWQYWQRERALEAAALYDTLERAAAAGEEDRVQRVWADLQREAPSAAQAHQAALLVAKTLADRGKLDDAKTALRFVLDRSRDEGLVAIARLRLAGLEIEAKAYDDALRTLEAAMPKDLQPLQADRRGDALAAQGRSAEARDAYLAAWKGMDAETEYRRLVEAKLNALGVDPAASAEKGQS